jgi:nitrogen regulatory protein P-II 1
MKKIEAIIRPFKLEEVKDALGVLGLEGLTVSEVKRFGTQNERTGIYRGSGYPLNLLPKIKVEVVVRDTLAVIAAEAIVKATRSGKTGDDSVFISAMDNALRIRTAESGEDAL